MQQLKVLTLIAAERDRATGHDLAEVLSVSVATMSGLVDLLGQAEHWFGAARGEADVAVVLLGQGLGTIIFSGRSAEPSSRNPSSRA